MTITVAIDFHHSTVAGNMMLVFAMGRNGYAVQAKMIPSAPTSGYDSFKRWFLAETWVLKIVENFNFRASAKVSLITS